jgi:hypothetical protein
MMLFGFTQLPSILLVLAFAYLASAIHNPAFNSVLIAISYTATAVVQAFLFAVYSSIMLYRPEKKGRRLMKFQDGLSPIYSVGIR